MCDKNFCRTMRQTYVSAALGTIVSDYMTRGMNGAQSAPECGDTLLNGLQGGTYYIAYPIACEILKRNCEHFRHNYEDKDGCKALAYLEAGSLGAALVVTINYPISILQKKRSGQKVEVSAKQLFSNFVDQVGSSVGFAATMNTISANTTLPKNSILNWGANLGVAAISDLGGTLCAYPLRKLNHGTTLKDAISGWIHSIPSSLISDEAFTHFLGVTASLP